jgi:hypothetical protein
MHRLEAERGCPRLKPATEERFDLNNLEHPASHLIFIRGDDGAMGLFQEDGSWESWLGLLEAFRTICIDPKEEIRATFEAMRNSWILV